ncbi:MAG: potassium-transporting ATPase subunit KdpC [Paludibacter sp.]|nr:potassium-transporting ATPase subunit KdpC [Paludibacter sp.]
MKTVNIAIRIFLIFTVLTGIIYPLFVTGIAQLVFPHQAKGSLIIKDNKLIGSELIGQNFDSTIYFSSRPSATGYSSLPSGGTNYGPTNEKLRKLVDERRNRFKIFYGLESNTEVPSEMLFASASGLDPHISPEAATLQINRIAEARNFNAEQKQKLEELVKKITQSPQLTCLGKSRVNVLLLNIELDKIK